MLSIKIDNVALRFYCKCTAVPEKKYYKGQKKTYFLALLRGHLRCKSELYINLITYCFPA